MAQHFFPRNFYGAAHGDRDTERTFTPLFRLLDDFDKYSSGRPGARAPAPSFQPKFDVLETEKAYELYGDLPGAIRENVHVEFTDPQTVVIRGHVKHVYSSGTPLFITEGGEEKDHHGRSSSPPSKVRVQDETEAEAEEQGSEAIPTPETSVAKTAVPTGPTKKADIRYWITERSVGDFTRQFSLPARIEQEGVSANLKDGVLTVVIPKAKKHEARRININ